MVQELFDIQTICEVSRPPFDAFLTSGSDGRVEESGIQSATENVRRTCSQVGVEVKHHHSPHGPAYGTRRLSRGQQQRQQQQQNENKNENKNIEQNKQQNKQANGLKKEPAFEKKKRETERTNKKNYLTRLVQPVQISHTGTRKFLRDPCETFTRGTRDTDSW